ncbi:MAG: site-specific integrase [Symploca sp. SIO2B6]|nr:site-specific integrase [Symploca sp. SIO2B6]
MLVTPSTTTHSIDFAKIRAKLKRCPYKQLTQASDIINWAMAQLTRGSAKRFLLQLRAACNWATAAGVIEDNPFSDMPKFKTTTDRTPDPFTPSEQHLILGTFQRSADYAYYAEFVEFLFLTGARPSEAIALDWEHISNERHIITFCQAVVEGVRKDTKTHQIRRFPINSQLQALFERIAEKADPATTTVFPGPKGSLIDQHNFASRAWRKTLQPLPIRYRPPYSMRHTFITSCLEKGIGVPQVASWVGNSPKTIWEHYAGVICVQDVPTFE